MNKNTWEQNKSGKLTIEQLKAIYGMPVGGRPPRRATKKGAHHKIGDHFKPLPISTSSFKKNHLAHRLILAQKNKPKARHEPDQSKRVACVNQCGSYVQPPQAICRDCRRAGRRRAAKVDYKQRKAERNENH